MSTEPLTHTAYSFGLDFLSHSACVPPHAEQVHLLKVKEKPKVLSQKNPRSEPLQGFHSLYNLLEKPCESVQYVSLLYSQLEIILGCEV
jgi:hypothetical protein